MTASFVPESPLLDVRDLTVSFGPEQARLIAVAGVSLLLAAGEVLGIVGESGCGKTAMARAVIGLNRSDPRCRVGGEVRFKGRDLVGLSERRMRAVRGREIAMIFQDPLASLNPLQRIGTQIGEILRAHMDLSASAIADRVVELLHLVGIPQPRERARAYPHQFSGGMRQRVMIAMAIACDPSLLIADEPTTALDVTTQLQILRLLGRLRDRTGMAVLLITHDFGVVAEIADKVMVMYAGQCVEAGDVREIFRHPRHPYTAGLLASIPSADRPRMARLPSIAGVPPQLTRARGAACTFRPRCEIAHRACSQAPELEQRAHAPGHLTRCWQPLEPRA